MRSVQFCFTSVSIRIFFLSFFFFFLFLLVFSLTDTNDSKDSKEGRRNHYFSCIPLPPAHKHSFSSTRFLPLAFNQSICNYQNNSWWDFFSLKIYILFAFSLMQLDFSIQSDILRIWTHIKLTPFFYKENVSANWDWQL